MKNNKNILPLERRQNILKILQKNNSVSVKELSQQFDVSRATIRNDLSDLEKKGLIKRTYGGAILDKEFGSVQEYETRMVDNIEKKSRIGKKAASLVEDKSTLMIDTGTTTLQAVKALDFNKDLTVITDSLPINRLLMNETGMEIFLLGGKISRTNQHAYGELAEENLKKFRARLSILGIMGVHPEQGFTEAERPAANIKKGMLESSQKSIVIADSTKFSTVSLVPVAGFKEVDVLITDSGADEEILADIEESGVNVITV